MKSEKAIEILTEATNITVLLYYQNIGDTPLELSVAKRAVEAAERETEERMREKAHKIILDMMTGIFHGDMPQKIADEFI